jgi:hypothetical protein
MNELFLNDILFEDSAASSATIHWAFKVPALQRPVFNARRAACEEAAAVSALSGEMIH